MMDWINVKDFEDEPIPINTTLLGTDGNEVFPVFYDSYFEWHFLDQELCCDHDFDVLYWMELPEPP